MIYDLVWKTFLDINFAFSSHAVKWNLKWFLLPREVNSIAIFISCITWIPRYDFYNIILNIIIIEISLWLFPSHFSVQREHDRRFFRCRFVCTSIVRVFEKLIPATISASFIIETTPFPIYSSTFDMLLVHKVCVFNINSTTLFRASSVCSSVATWSCAATNIEFLITNTFSWNNAKRLCTAQFSNGIFMPQNLKKSFCFFLSFSNKSWDQNDAFRVSRL